MRLTNKYRLPEPIVRAVQRDPYTKGGSNYSVTELIDSPRVRALRWEHDDEIEEDVSERLFSLMGQAMHHVLERGARDGEEAEERIHMNLVVDGVNVTVSGSMDLQETAKDEIGITDYKVTSVYSFQSDKADWVSQLNMYADLARSQGKPVKWLRVCAFLRDWVSGKAKTDPNYPQAAMQIMNIPMWGADFAHQFIIDRVSLHVRAAAMMMAGADIPECTDQERWMSSPTYACVKNIGARASRVFDNVDEASSYAKEKGLTVEIRKAEPKRCTGDWCKVSKFCDQYQETLHTVAERLSEAS